MKLPKKPIDPHAGIRACEERIAEIYSRGLPPLPADYIAGRKEQKLLELREEKAVKKFAETWAGVIAEELSKEGIGGMTARREIVQRAKTLARQGVPWAIQWLADREEGRPKQQVDLAGRDGGPMVVNIVSFAQAIVEDNQSSTPQSITQDADKSPNLNKSDE